MSYRYAEIGKRFEHHFQAFYKNRQKEFCDLLGIKETDLPNYFCGKRSPVSIGFQRLIAVNIDLTYLLTGKYTIPFEELLALDALHERGYTTPTDIYKLLLKKHRCVDCPLDKNTYGDNARLIHEMLKLSKN